MDIGSRVRDKNNNSVGIIERQNLSSFLVAFEGGRKLWRKAHELEPESARSSSTARPSPSPTLRATAKPSASPQFQPQHLPPQRQPQSEPQPSSPQLGRAPAQSPRSQPLPSPPTSSRPTVGSSSPAPARPTLGAPAPSPGLSPKLGAGPPAKSHFDSTDNRQPTITQPPPISLNNSNGKVEPPAASPRQEKGPAPTVPIWEEMWNIEFNELEFGDVIGTGKFGEVYLGTYLGTPVAIKKILECDEETKISIEREIAMLKGAKHPNIVQFLGLCYHKDDIFLVTEYMDRGDLFDVLFFGDTQLSWKMKLKIALDIAMPCYYLQAKNILHRDLKSQNILLCSENYKAKLCDLGLARALDTASRRMTFVGTDRWMAPEICLGIDYDYKVDVFSYGVVLMEIITQGVPDERRAQDKFAFNEGAFRAKVPKSCPAAFAQLAIDCTKLDPRTRPTFKSILDRVRRMYEEEDD